MVVNAAAESYSHVATPLWVLWNALAFAASFWLKPVMIVLSAAHALSDCASICGHRVSVCANGGKTNDAGVLPGASDRPEGR